MHHISYQSRKHSSQTTNSYSVYRFTPPLCVNKKPTIHRKQNESSDSSAAKAASGASPAGTEQEGISESNPFDNLPASNEETFLLLEISAFLDGYTGPTAPENPSVPSAAQADSVLLAELDSFIAQ